MATKSFTETCTIMPSDVKKFCNIMNDKKKLVLEGTDKFTVAKDKKAIKKLLARTK